MLPADMQAKYRKISAPVYAVWSDFGPVADWPHEGDWGASTNLVTAAKLRSFYSAEALSSGTLPVVGLLNAGAKQVGKLGTYYLLTGAYTDEDPEAHNVARALPLVDVETGARLTVLSIRVDGSRYEAVPESGAALRPNLDFAQDFVAHVDLRVGEVLATEEVAGAWVLAADFGGGLRLQSHVDPALFQAVGAEGILGSLVVGMVNVEPSQGNGFLLLGFMRGDGAAVPLSVDRVGEALPPLGAHLM